MVLVISMTGRGDKSVSGKSYLVGEAAVGGRKPAEGAAAGRGATAGARQGTSPPAQPPGPGTDRPSAPSADLARHHLPASQC